MQNGELSGNGEYKDNQGGGAGLPLTKTDKNDGKKQLTNGLYRVHRILTEEEVNQGKEARWTELEIHGRVRNLSSALWDVQHLSALFLNGNQLSRVPVEISKLRNLTLLDLSHNKLRSVPPELGDMITLCHLYLNNNMIRILPFELGKLFRIQTLGLGGNPLSPDITKIYHEANGHCKLLQYLLDHLAILVNTAPPPDRNWVMVRQCDPERPIATFTVLCYNVLCDKYATVNQYSYCPSWALNWEYRKVNIMKEIRNYEADIITLQEVEMDQFRTMFQPELKGLGYTGIFSPKSRARTMSEEDRKFVDGCAIFWKSDKFDLDREHVIEFTSLVTKKASSSQHMLNRVMPRDNIALCAVLKIKDNVYQSRGRIGMSANDNVVGSPLVVCTAHIHWDPEFCDVKLVQTMMLAHEMHKIIEDVAVHYNISSQQTPVLICGDLNSLPDSGVYEYLSRGHIARNHPDLKDFRNDQSLDTFVYSSDGDQLTHALKLESAVDTNITPFTNYTLDFKGMIDYIFSTPQSLARLGVLGSIEQTWVNQNKIIGFPHPHVPSDHIPIMAQYAIIPPSHQRQVNNLPPVTSSSTTSQLGPNGSLTPTFSR